MTNDYKQWSEAELRGAVNAALLHLANQQPDGILRIAADDILAAAEGAPAGLALAFTKDQKTLLICNAVGMEDARKRS